MRIIQLHTNDGRKVAALDTDNSTVYKQVKGGTHMLRKPPAWTYDEAILKYDSVLTAFSGHSLSDEIYMRKAGIYLNNGNIEDALVNYEKIEEDWSYDILADDALYKRAKIYDDILNNSELAMKLYEQILLEHNSSIYVAESRKRFRDLRGDNLKTIRATE